MGFVEEKFQEFWSGRPEFRSLGSARTTVLRPRLIDKRSTFLTIITQCGWVKYKKKFSEFWPGRPEYSSLGLTSNQRHERSQVPKCFDQVKHHKIKRKCLIHSSNLTRTASYLFVYGAARILVKQCN